MKLVSTVFKALMTQSLEHRTRLLNRQMHDKLLTLLRKIDREVRPLKTVYDIGAHEGRWAVEMQRVFRKADFFLFEANPLKKEALEETGLRFFISALSSDECYVDFYSKDGTGDSYYRENSSNYDSVMPLRIKTNTLDNLTKEQTLPIPDLLKIDTQGSELDILAGGRHIMENVPLVYVECPLQAYNLHAPSFGEYLEFFKAAGFIPLEIGEAHYAYNSLVQVDLLFASKSLHHRLCPGASANLYALK